MVTILAIDDHPDNLLSLKALIGESIPDARVVTATDGLSGLNLAETEKPDVILLDIVMPGMDGFEVCARLKKNNETHGIPVVFLTALRGDKESRIRALEVGGEAFLAKPIDETELTAQIRAMVKIRNARLSEQEEKKRLQQLVDEQTRDLIHQVYELKKRDNELIRAREKAEQSDRLKSAFLANMSHEIRTPMNAIVGFAQVLSDPDLTPQEREHFVSIIQSRSEDLLHIINAILDISRIESGNLTLVHHEVNVNDIMEEIITLYREKVPEDKRGSLGFILDMPLPREEAQLVLDPYIFRQVMTNLIDNAIKYTHSGSITCGYTLDEGSMVTFFVSDTGIGISPENQEIIFDHFRQADIPDAQVYGGTGLGLAICRGLLHQLDGDISVESEPGKGSTFRFTVPRIQPNAETGKRIDGTDTTPEPQSAINWSGNKLLVVEDDESNREFLDIILSRTGAEISYARSGAELQRYIPELGLFDLVLLDIRLPDASGWELIDDIRKNRQDIPVIAQTAYAMASDEQKSREKGFNAYISKPIDKERLLEIVGKWMKISST